MRWWTVTLKKTDEDVAQFLHDAGVCTYNQPLFSNIFIGLPRPAKNDSSGNALIPTKSAWVITQSGPEPSEYSGMITGYMKSRCNFWLDLNKITIWMAEILPKQYGMHWKAQHQRDISITLHNKVDRYRSGTMTMETPCFRLISWLHTRKLYNICPLPNKNGVPPVGSGRFYIQK